MESPVLGIIMGLVVLVAISFLATMHFHQMEQFRYSLDANVISASRIRAGMDIINITCSETSTEVIVENVGREKLILDTIDVFFPKILPRNESNRTFEIIDDIIDPGLWNPNELLNVTIFVDISQGNHTFAISNEFGARDSIECELP